MGLRVRAGLIDLVRGVLERDDGPVPLTALEVRLLERLARSAGEPVDRDALLRDVWGLDPSRTTTRSVDVAVRRLRQKIERDAEHPEHLRTAHGQGYQLDPLVEVEAPVLVHRGGVAVVLATGAVLDRDGGADRLPDRDLAVLRGLAGAIGPMAPADLHREAFGTPLPSGSRAIEVSVARLRDRLEPDPTEPAWIVGRPLTGYRLAPPSDDDWIALLSRLPQAETEVRRAVLAATEALLATVREPERIAALASRLSAGLAWEGDPDGSARVLEDALARGPHRPEDEIDLLVRMGAAMRRRRVEGQHWVDAALDVAVQHGLTEAECRVRSARAVYALPGRPWAGVADADAAVALARGEGMPRRRLADALRTRALIRDRLGRYAEAAEDARAYLAAAEGLPPHPDVDSLGLWMAAVVLADAGHLDEAREVYVRLATATWTTPSAASRRMNGRFAIAAVDQARGVHDPAASLDPSDLAALVSHEAGDAQLVLARIAIGRGDGREAIERLRLAAADPLIERPLLRLWTAAARLLLGDLAAAGSALRDGLAPTPDARVTAAQAVLGPVLVERCGLTLAVPAAGDGEPLEARIARRVLPVLT